MKHLFNFSTSRRFPRIMWILMIFITGIQAVPVIPAYAEDTPLIFNLPEETGPGDLNLSSIFPAQTATPVPFPTSFVEPANSLYRRNPTDIPRSSPVWDSNGTSTPEIPGPVYAESGLELNGTPLGRILNIEHGPFIVEFTIHPKVNNPLIEWAKVEIYDPWGTLISEGGYNRHYPANTIQQLTVYRTGTFSLKMDGDFVSLDITLRTTDPTPSGTQTPVPEELDE